MKFFIVLSLVIGSALAETSVEASAETSVTTTETPDITTEKEYSSEEAAETQLYTGSGGSNSLINTTFGVNRYSILQMAIYLNQSDHILPLIQKGANVNVTNRIGYTPLHTAARIEPDNAARLLIENGADVNAKVTVNKLTPLHFAYLSGQQNIVNSLINKGADQEALNRSGKKPRDFENDPRRQEAIDYMNQLSAILKRVEGAQYYNIIKALGIA